MARVGELRLTIRHLFIVVPFVGLAWAVSSPFRDNSFLWHVRAGTLQLDQGAVLTVDPFSIEYAGEAWRTQSWLADIGYGWLERVTGGIGWAPLYMFLLATLTAILVLLTTYRHVAHLGVTAVASILLIWQAAPFANARPVVFSYLLLAAVAAALHSGRMDWVLPPLIWLWAMLHGSFVMGIGLIMLVAIKERSRRRAEVAAAATILATLTAHGIGVWLVLLRFLENREALSIINEWQPPDYTNPLMLPGVVLMAGLIYSATRGRLATPDLIVVLPFLVYGMLAVRNLYPAMIVLLPHAAAGLVPAKEEVRRRESPLVLGTVMLAVSAIILAGLIRPFELSEDLFPGTAALAAIDRGPLFHGSAAGGFFIYTEWPDRAVVFDDRAELYGYDGFARYLDAADARGWEELFSELAIEQALLEPDWPLTSALAAAGWVERFRDESHVVMAASP